MILCMMPVRDTYSTSPRLKFLVFIISQCVVYSSTVIPHCDLWPRILCWHILQAGRRQRRVFSPARSSWRSTATTSTAVTTKRPWSTSPPSTHTRSLPKRWGDPNTQPFLHQSRFCSVCGRSSHSVNSVQWVFTVFLLYQGSPRGLYLN